MAQCPHCQSELPESETRQCPSCGGDLGSSAVPSPLPPTVPPPPTVSGSPIPPADVSPPEPPPGSPPVPPATPPTVPPPPAGGDDPPGGGGRPARGGVPWEERDRLGFGTALVETTRQVLGSPTSFYQAMPAAGGIGSALLYAVIVGWLGVVAATFYSALYQSIVGPGFGAFGENPELAAFLTFTEGWAGFVLQVILAPLGLLIGLFLASGIFHVMLLVLGGAREDFEATFRVVGYAQATSVLMVLPFCGSFVAGIWSLVLYIIGLSTVHRISGGKAAAAVLLPLALVCCCCGLLVALFLSSIAALGAQLQ